MKLVKVLGCPIHPFTFQQTLDKIEEFIRSGKTHQLVVVNAAKIILMNQDARLRQIVGTADLVGVDGVPVIWAARLLGQNLPERINGTDLMDALIRLSAQKNYRIYFLGARESVLDKAMLRLKLNFPAANVVGWHHGYFSEMEEPALVAQINATRPDILFVGMGTPKKEYWIRLHLPELQVPVIHGVGGSIDILAGTTRRAPLWMQKNGLEWFYRVLQEPQRMWKRYLVTNSIFTVMVLKEFIRVRIFRRNPATLNRIP